MNVLYINVCMYSCMYSCMYVSLFSKIRSVDSLKSLGGGDLPRRGSKAGDDEDGTYTHTYIHVF